MLKTLEHHEHAEHIAHAAAHAGAHEGAHEGAHNPSHAGLKGKLLSAQLAALLVSGLAAGLALAEQGAKHAEIKVQANLVNAVDAWAQYQAKSTRGTIAKDIGSVITALDPPASQEVADRRALVVKGLVADQERFDKDPLDGREAIARRARDFEAARDHALEQTHAYHNASAAMELGIVLSTASALIGSRYLIVAAMVLGAAGVACTLAGYFAPEWGAF